ncbi:MAG: phage tail tape measure protein [Oscillospiraceae bacterium]|nr:phage tail tape measure protein [Oscillospiraceae bacterium]
MATDRSQIKGLTVEIGGDASDLDKELKSIEKQSRKSNEELRDINNLLKLDPKSTELLAQKQAALASAIEGASKKLETLKAAEKSARDQLERGDIGQEQFRALQRETIRAENQLHKLEKQLADTEQAAKDVTQSADDAAGAVRDAGNAADTAAQKTGDLADSLDDLKGKYQDAKEAAKDAVSDLGKIGAAGIAAGAAVLVPASGKEDALASIQAGSGASASEMVLYEKGIDDIYGEGFGEDLDDIANTMATIKQLSGETRSDALNDLTKDAIALRDTFGYETQESMRTSKMLVDQFGLSYKASFNLIAQATQKGLNRNGDLLDILNEYSVHFKGLGYDAEGMLGVLKSGAASGAFSLDKVGDAAKELKIRLLDTADSNTEALARLGFDAEEFRKRIAAGGPAAQQASSEVINALLLMDNQVAQNEIGVALFGTMWEDLGVDAIASLANVNTSMDSTKDTMQEIRDIKYGTTSNEWKKLGRTVQTELITPMGEKLLPTAKKFCSYLSQNLDSLIPTIKKVATTAASIYVGMKAAQMAGAVVKLVQAFKALKTATLASNAAMAATPWGAIGAAIGLVVGSVISLASAEREAEEAAREHLRELKAAAEEQTAVYRDSAQAAFDAAAARRDTAGAINDEYDSYGKLMDELENLVDAEGNVLKGNEERVDFIRGVLSDAIGEEIELVDGQIQKYQDLKNTIADTLALKRGEAMAAKLEGDYNEAKDTLSEKQAAYERANSMIPEYEQKMQEYANLQRQYADHLAVTFDGSEEGPSWEVEWSEMAEQMEADIAEAKAWFAEAGDVYANQRYTRAEYDAARASIDLYEDLTEAIYGGSTEQILAATKAMETGMATFSQGAAYTTLYDQAVELYQAHSDAVKMSQNKGSTYQQSQLSEMQALAEKAVYEAYMAAQAQGAPQQILQSLGKMMDKNELMSQVGLERIQSFSDTAAGTLIEAYDRSSELAAEGLISSISQSSLATASTMTDAIWKSSEAASQKMQEGLGQVQKAINNKELVAVVRISPGDFDTYLGVKSAHAARGRLEK